MNSFLKTALISIAALIVTWIGVGLYIDHKRSLAEKELRQKELLHGRYETLKQAWSEKSRKRAVKKLNTLLRLYRVQPKTKKQRNQKIYTFTLEKRNADSVLNKLLNSHLVIKRFAVKKIDDQHIEVTVGVLL